jgi:DNA gyrase inhibitor GyrI
MENANVQIVNLEPRRVASAWAFGRAPEEAAWKKLQQWAQSRGLLHESAGPLIFGFNNPSPSSETPNYGYEFCLVVGPQVEPEAKPETDIRIQNLTGGLYAVMPFTDDGGDPYETIPAAWRQLDAWVKTSGHKAAHQRQCYEAHSAQGKLEALYYPIAR